MLCVAGLAATGSEKLELLRNYERNISDFSTRHVALAPADARWENTGKSFRIHWKAETAETAMAFRQTEVLQKFDKLELKLSYSLPKNSQLTMISLRLVDAQGEFFEKYVSVPDKKSGMQELSFLIYPDKLTDTANFAWSKKAVKNGKLDFPVRLFGFVFHNKGKKSGCIDLANIRFQTWRKAAPTPPESDTFSTVFSMDLSELPAQLVHFAPVKTSCRTISVGNEKFLRTTWPENTSTMAMAFRRQQVIKPFKKLNVELDFSLPEKSAVNSVALRLIDAKGEVFQPEFALPAGKSGTATAKFTIDPEKLTDIPSWIWSKTAVRDRKMDFPIRLFGVVTQNSSGKTGYIDFKNIRLVTEGKLSDFTKNFSVSLDTGRFMNILEPGKDKKLELVIHNPQKISGTFLAEIDIKGYRGKRYCQTLRKTVTFAPGQEMRLALPIPDQLGIWYADCRLTSQNCPTDTTVSRASFAYIIPTGLTKEYDVNDFKFTVCSHPEWSDDKTIWDREGQAMALLGARYLRNGTAMKLLRADLSYDTEKFLGTTAAFEKYGVERIASLGYCSDWGAADKKRAAERVKKGLRCSAMAPDLKLWRIYVQKTLKYAGNRIRFWELWNEIDLMVFCEFDAKTYHELVKICREEINKLAPKSKLMTSGYAHFYDPQKGYFQEETLKMSKDYFDIHCFHGHGPFQFYVGQIDGNLIPMRKRLNMTIPWYAHETAISSTGYGEDMQAETLYKKLLYSWARGSIGYTWYNLRNKGRDLDDPEHNFGLLTDDFQPRLVSGVYNMLTSVFGKAGTRFVRQHKEKNGVWIFEFANKDNTILGIWSENRENRQLFFAADAVEGELVDLMGNRKKAAKWLNFFAVPLGIEPVTLLLPPGTKVSGTVAPFAVAESLLVTPGREKQFAINLFNPLRKNAQMKVTLKIPDYKDVTETINLKAGEKCTKQLNVSVRKNFSSQDIRFVCSLDGAVFEESFYVNSSILLHPDFPSKPHFVLNRRDQVYSFFANNPHHVDKVWGNPADLSVKAFMAGDRTHLKLKFEVTDDTHVFHNSVWGGDSVQFFLQFANQYTNWEMGAGLNPGVGTVKVCWNAPGKNDRFTILDHLSVSASREGNITRYQFSIPWEKLKVSPTDLKNGFRFNFLINDNDKGMREGWISTHGGRRDSRDLNKFSWVAVP